MALIKKIQLDSGIECPEAYYRITDIRLSYKENRAWLRLSCYYNTEARFSGKVPMFETDEYRVYNSDGRPSVQAKYNIQIAPLTIGCGSILQLDLDDNGISEVVIEEGRDFIVIDDTNRIENLQSIVDVLNSEPTFNIGWTASLEGDSVSIQAKLNSTYDGLTGNKVLVTGDMALGFAQTVQGVEKIIGTFDNFFSVESMTNNNTNVIKQGYLYLKTQSDFNGPDCHDDAEDIVK